MVNVRRSTGCGTCKKRKVKCDEAKPFCDRCSRAYMICEGYQKGEVFVDGGKRFQNTPNHFKGGEPLAGKQANIGSCESNLLGKLPVQPQLIHPLQKTLSLKAFESNVFISFLESNLFPPASRLEPDPSRRWWLLDAIEEDRTFVVYDAANCLAMALFGRTHYIDPNIRDVGAICYGKALRRLGRNLEDPILCQDPANIAAAFMLGRYEILVHNNRGGWIKHAGGTAKLIESRGLEAHLQQPAKNYFQYCRYSIIDQAWQTRRRTFLEQKPWRAILASDAPTSQASLNRILDVLATIPGLLEDTDRFKGTDMAITSASNPERLAFHKRLVEVLAELFLWRWDWELIHPRVASEVLVDPTISTTVDENGIPLYQTIFSYCGILQCGQLLLYNAALYRVLQLATDWEVRNAPSLALSSLSHQNRPRCMNPLVLPHEALSPTEPASEICRSIEYCLHEPHAAVGAMSLMLPLGVLLSAPLVNIEKRWLARTTRSVAVLSSIERY